MCPTRSKTYFFDDPLVLQRVRGVRTLNVNISRSRKKIIIYFEMKHVNDNIFFGIHRRVSPDRIYPPFEKTAK